MAVVRPEGQGRRDRGQMILVAAFGVAVMLVALALILNTSIYTENIATRGSDISGGKETKQYRSATEETFNRTVRYVNENNNTTSSYDEIENPAKHAVWNYSNMTGRHWAKNSVVVNLSLKRQSRGTHVFQRSVGNLSNESDEGNWTVAEDADGVRDFTINVTRTSLSNESQGNADRLDPIFRVNFSTSFTWYRIYVYNESGASPGSEEVVIQGEDSLGNARTCTRKYDANDRAQINFTNKSAQNEYCPALDMWGALSGDPFDMDFNHTCVTDGTDACDSSAADTYNANGTLSFIVNESIDDTNVEPGTAAGDPDARTAIYSMTVHTVYESTRLYFETDIRVAPGEPDD